jgi:hypothetical protein
MANGQKNTTNEQLGSYIQEPVKDLEPEQVTNLPSQPDFYKVPKRFGSIPVDELPLGCDSKEQYYKIYPRVSLPFQRVERISFGHPELDPNRLFFGDNLHVMRMLPSNSNRCLGRWDARVSNLVECTIVRDEKTVKINGMYLCSPRLACISLCKSGNGQNFRI